MQYLGIEPRRLRAGLFDFTGCEGCQLQLLNKEETLGAFLDALDIVAFREGSSAPDPGGPLDVAFIDGCISRDDEVERIRAIRERATTLVAMGSCACFGGVNRARNALSLDEANRIVYGDHPQESGPVRAVHEVVEVDVALPGCPIHKDEAERAVRHLVLGLDLPVVVHPVCVECKHRFTTCIMDLGELCLGPVTRGGCGAPCPAGGIGCWGCRGPAEEANLVEFVAITRDRGFPDEQVDERFAFFGGFDGITCAVVGG